MDIASERILKMRMNFNEALEHAKNCRIDGHEDWRVPSIQELSTLIFYKRENIDISCLNFDASYYWSSTTDAEYSDSAWGVYFGDVSIGNDLKNYCFYVKCVRGGEYDKLGNLIFYNLNDDKTLFTINDETIVDNRTGLEWEK